MADNTNEQEPQAAPAVSDVDNLQGDDERTPAPDMGTVALERHPAETLEAYERRVREANPPTV